MYVLLHFQRQRHFVVQHATVHAALQGAGQTNLIGEALEEYGTLELTAAAHLAQGYEVGVKDVAQGLQMTAYSVAGALLGGVQIENLDVLRHDAVDGLGYNLAALGHILKVNAASDSVWILHKAVQLEGQ